MYLHLMLVDVSDVFKNLISCFRQVLAVSATPLSAAVFFNQIADETVVPPQRYWQVRRFDIHVSDSYYAQNADAPVYHMLVWVHGISVRLHAAAFLAAKQTGILAKPNHSCTPKQTNHD